MPSALNAIASQGSGDDAETVYRAVANCLGAARDHLAFETTLIDDLGFDSIDMLALAISLEESFDVVITDHELSRIRTIGDAISYINVAIELQRIEVGAALVAQTGDEGPTP